MSTLLRYPVPRSPAAGAVNKPQLITPSLAGVLNAVSDTLDLRWDIKENIQDILNLQWNILNNIQDNIDLRWNIVQNAQDTIDLRWDISGNVQDLLDLRWNIQENILDTLDLRWNIPGTVLDTLDLRWALSGSVFDTLDLRWELIETLAIGQLLIPLIPNLDPEAQRILEHNFRILIQLFEAGQFGQFTTVDGKTVTVEEGLITDIN